MGGTLRAEQLDTHDLCTIARAHWRELKGQLPDGPSKVSMQAILDEVTYRIEQQPHSGGSSQSQQQVSGRFENSQSNMGSQSQFAGNVPQVT